MTKSQWELFIELALAVREMAAPDRQLSIDRKLQAMDDEARETAIEEQSWVDDANLPTADDVRGILK